MTTTTKFSAAPTTYSNEALTATTAARIEWTGTSTAANSFVTARSVKVFLVGQSDANKEPTKAINAWWAANSSAITAASLQKSLQVSSWAIVVDIEWATDLKTVAAAPNATHTVTATSASPYKSGAQTVIATNTWPEKDTFGEHIGIFLTVKD